MITAVDSSVLPDVLTDHSLRGSASARALAAARGLGRVVIRPIVWAEVGAHSCRQPASAPTPSCARSTGRHALSIAPPPPLPAVVIVYPSSTGRSDAKRTER